MLPANDTSIPRLRLACSYHFGQQVELVTRRELLIGLEGKSIGILKISKTTATTRHRLLILPCMLTILRLGQEMDSGHMFMSIKMDLKARFALQTTTPFFRIWAILVWTWHLQAIRKVEVQRVKLHRRRGHRRAASSFRTWKMMLSGIILTRCISHLWVWSCLSSFRRWRWFLR